MGRLGKATYALRSPVLRRALGLGVGAAIEHRALLQKIRPDYVVDVGANRGQFSLVARSTVPSCRIIAFEPLPEPADVYRKVFAGCPDVTLHQCALSAEAGVVDMHVSAKDDSSSLLPISEAQVREFPGTQEKGSLKVEVKRLEDVVAAPPPGSVSMLKIDVQGSELQTIEGGGAVLGQFDYIYVELSFEEFYVGQCLFDEFADRMRDRGFRLYDVGRLARNAKGQLVQGDFLFARQR